MVSSSQMRNSYFLDTSYSIALTIESDEFHDRASLLNRRLITENAQIVTSQAVVLEIGDGLARQRYRRFAIDAFELLECSPNIKVVSLSDAIISEAMLLFRDRMDKEWSLVDCTSIVIMQNLGIDRVLSADEHFNQAGFRALLREN